MLVNDHKTSRTNSGSLGNQLRQPQGICHFQKPSEHFRGSSKLFHKPHNPTQPVRSVQPDLHAYNKVLFFVTSEIP